MMALLLHQHTLKLIGLEELLNELDDKRLENGKLKLIIIEIFLLMRFLTGIIEIVSLSLMTDEL